MGYFFPQPHPRLTPVNASLEQYALSAAEQMGAYGRYTDFRSTVLANHVQHAERP